MERKQVVVEGQSVPVFVWPAEPRAGGARTIVFLHGLFRRPADHAPFLTELARLRDGAGVVAPFFLGNNGLDRPPRSLTACEQLADGLLDALRIREAPYDLVGHSTGGTMALALASHEPRPRAVVAINPILPILPEKRGVREFVRRGLRIGRKQFLGQAGPWGKGIWLVVSTGPALGWTFARKYRASAALIRSIAEFQWEQLERAPATPVHLLLGAGDEFFTPSTDLEATLRAGPFPTALVPPVSGQNSHEWLLLDPKLAAELVDGALRAG